MLTKEQQLKEWDRVVAMCKGTKFEGKEYLCVKKIQMGVLVIYEEPPLIEKLERDRIFAVAIVDDTPIWLEEPFTLYNKTKGYEDIRFEYDSINKCIKSQNSCVTVKIPVKLMLWEDFTLTKPNTLIKPETEENFITEFNKNIENIGQEAEEACRENRKFVEEYNQNLANIDIPLSKVDSKQVGGNHYKAKAIQPWAYMEANFTKEEFVGYLKGNAHKYLDRYKDKNGVEDLKKAIHYIEKLIQVESK